MRYQKKPTKKQHLVQTADNVSRFQKNNLKVQPACPEPENNDRNQQTFKFWQAKLFTSNKL